MANNCANLIQVGIEYECGRIVTAEDPYDATRSILHA